MPNRKNRGWMLRRSGARELLDCPHPPGGLFVQGGARRSESSPEVVRGIYPRMPLETFRAARIPLDDLPSGWVRDNRAIPRTTLP